MTIIRRRALVRLPRSPGFLIRARTRFEQEIQDLDLRPTGQAEIGGYWVQRGDYSIMRIVLIDPSGVFKNKKALRETIVTKLRHKFAALDPQLLDKHAIEVRAEYRQGEPTSDEKSGFGKLDFPVYLLGSQHPYSYVRRQMEAHGIPKTVRGADVYKKAENGWTSRDVRGVGIPSGRGYRKVAFIKTQKVFADAKSDPGGAFVNVIGHEIGHMGNRTAHSKTGLMKYPVRLDVEMDFADADRLAFLGNLVRLKAL